MSLQYLNFAAIAESDLARLVADAVGESKPLEFKEALTLVTDEQKRELLSDITALANTEGGDLVLGMKAEKGVAKDLVGLRNLVPDDTYGKIENLLRDFVQPRLSGVQIRVLLLANGNHAMLIRVPRSFSAPHMVRHQGVTRFCGRNSNGKYDLDVHELRSAFLANESLSERLKAFRLERINRLILGNAPVKLAGEHLLVLHLLPVVGARPDTRLTTPDLQRLLHEHTPHPIATGGGTPSFNFDGLLIAREWKNETYHSYVQILRSGFLEAVETQTLELTPARNEGQPPTRLIPSITWEKRIIAVFPSYLKALAELKLPPPYVASLSLINVRGYTMFVGTRHANYDARPVDRDHLLADEILIESVTDSAEKLLRPLFDQIWNSCGWHGSINYDEAGQWREHR